MVVQAGPPRGSGASAPLAGPRRSHVSWACGVNASPGVFGAKGSAGSPYRHLIVPKRRPPDQVRRSCVGDVIVHALYRTGYRASDLRYSE